MDPLSPCLPLYEFTSPVADVVPRGSPMMCGPFPRHARLLSKREGPGGGGCPCLRRAGRPWGDGPEPDGPSLGQPDPSLLTPGQGPACPPVGWSFHYKLPSRAALWWLLLARTVSGPALPPDARGPRRRLHCQLLGRPVGSDKRDTGGQASVLGQVLPGVQPWAPGWD